MNHPHQIAFLVDQMLIKLGVYLRILGYDAAWDQTLHTPDLITRANLEHRVFLTRNARLHAQFPVPARWLCLNSMMPVEQLGEVLAAYELDAERYVFSKCIRCNLPLVGVLDKQTIALAVHPNVFKRHEHFYKCQNCGTVFWDGSHVSNTRRKLQLRPLFHSCE